MDTGKSPLKLIVKVGVMIELLIFIYAIGVGLILGLALMSPFSDMSVLDAFLTAFTWPLLLVLFPFFEIHERRRVRKFREKMDRKNTKDSVNDD